MFRNKRIRPWYYRHWPYVEPPLSGWLLCGLLWIVLWLSALAIFVLSVASIVEVSGVR